MQAGLGRRLLLIAGGALAATLVLAIPADAHHGWGGYQDNEFELSGTAESSVSLAGPHATMKMRAADGTVWDVVMAPPNRTDAAGLKDGMIAKGDKIAVHGHRHRDAKKFEIKTERLTWNGRVYNVYPDRE